MPTQQAIEVSVFSQMKEVLVAFWSEALERNLSQSVSRNKDSRRCFDDDFIVDLGGPEVTWSWESRWSRRAILRYSTDCIIYLEGPRQASSSSRDFSWIVASLARSRSLEVSESIDAMLPNMEPKDKTIVPVTFWALGPNGPIRTSRDLVAPAWEDIRTNYTTGTQGAVRLLASLTPPLAGGQLMLMHGVPGTGKTYAIRALAREWKPWCDTHYILDPDEFFAHASYMMAVLLEHENAKRWFMLVIEDSDEFITIDAKQRTGQALSRLLNLSEGMVGQGLNLLLLMTTNEPFSKLHPAVARPGRCLANIEFGPLSHGEANEWLKSRGIDNISMPEATLATLYEEVRGRTAIRAGRPRSIGFVRAGVAS